MSVMTPPPEVTQETQTTEPSTEAPVKDVSPTEKPGKEAKTDAPPVKAWTPNFKYKVYDKEKEIPEDFRSFIKDEVGEKRFRELFEKADALDEHKGIHQKVLQQLDEHKTKATTAERELERATNGLKRLYQQSQSDLGAFFESYRIPEEAVIDYVRNLIQEKELPPEEQQHRRALRERARTADTYEIQLQEQQRQSRDMVMTQHQQAMEMALNMPDVASFKSQFDARFGAGSFERHVKDHGSRVYNTENGRYISPFECARAVMQFYAPAFQPTAPITTPATAQAQPQETPPAIPNVGTGRGVSPTKPQFKSLDQLKKFVKERYQET